MHRHFGSFVFAVFVGTAALAQTRQPLVGNVVDAEGKPIAGAAVTLVEDDVDLVGLDPVDVCSVTTDARGRFVASALVGVRYTAVASAPEVEGRAFVARAVPGLSCGQVAVLRAVVAGQRRNIAMPLDAELRAVPGLHVRMAFPSCPGHHVVLPIGEQGIEVPPLAAVASFSLRDGQGGFLGTVGVPEFGDLVAFLPSALRLAVRVVDETGAPVAGARVAVQDGSTGVTYEGPAVTTDAAGRASLLWGGWRDPFDAPPETLFVVATHAGFAEGSSGWVCKEPFVGAEIKKRHKGNEIVVPLTRRSPAPRGEADRAFAGRLARVDVVGHVHGSGGRRYFLPRSYEVLIAADGSYEVPQLPPSASTVRLQLPPQEGRRVELLPTHAPTLPNASLADIDAVKGQVIDEGGGPATSAEVLLACHQVGMTVQPVVLDAAGRFDRLLQRGRWTLLAMDDTGWVACELDGEVAGPIELRLAAMPQRRVRVLAADGSPVVGASFEPGEFRYGVPAQTGLRALLVDLGWNTFAKQMRRVRTDERGEATLHFLPWPGVVPTAFAFVGDHRRRSDDGGIEPGEDVVVFPLR